jgi:hypothetical protein
MDPEYQFGGVTVTDDYGNEYPPHSRSYAWAFVVALWHHAREGDIKPAFETDEQRAMWDAFFAHHKHLFGRPDVNAPQPLWDVPFRLAEGRPSERTRFVGWIGGE